MSLFVKGSAAEEVVVLIFLFLTEKSIGCVRIVYREALLKMEISVVLLRRIKQILSQMLPGIHEIVRVRQLVAMV